MAKRVRAFCDRCGKKTIHDVYPDDVQEIKVCLRCKFAADTGDHMLDLNYIDPRDRYSLKTDQVLEANRWYYGRPF